MKKIVLSLIVASASLLAAEYSYDERSYYQEESDRQVLISNQSTVSNVVVDAPRTELARGTSNYAASAQYIYTENYSVLNLPFGANIGSNFGVEFSLPLVSIKDYMNSSFEKEDNMGIGDISVGGNYHYGQMNESLGSNITTLLYKTTSGDEKKGLGSGEAAVTLSHKFSKNVTDNTTVHALLSYTLNDDKVSGNAYMAMLGGSMPCLINNDVTTSAKLTYFHVDEVTKNFLPEIKVADLWLNWDSNKIVSGMPLGFGVKIPLLSEVGSTEADKTFLFYLSASSLFN
jgi:hypothetical protein